LSRLIVLDFTPNVPDEGPYRNTSCVEWLAYGLIRGPAGGGARPACDPMVD
jgi:hypothetical protein